MVLPTLSDGAKLEILDHSDYDTMCRPCVECGRLTGAFCELECYAFLRVPSEFWYDGQPTPHCTVCDEKYGCCHFCRGVQMCRPFTWGRNEGPIAS